MKILVAGILLLIGSCKYNYSPYSVEIPKFIQNVTALDRIRKEEANPVTEFRIAFISDTHNYYDELAKLVKTLNKRGPYSFVIVAGDITNEGMRDEFLKTKEILNRLTWNYLVVVGNHDLLSNGRKVYSRLFGPQDFTFTYRDITFILMNNNNWESSGNIPDLSFLENALSGATTVSKVLVNHVGPDDKDRFSPSEISRMQTLISSYGVDYIFHGHNHKPADNSFGGARKITIGSPSKNVFYELISGPGGLSHQKISF